MHSVGAQKAKARYTRRLVKAIHEGTITIASGDTEETATIPAVDKAKSIILFLGFYTSTSNQDEIMPRVELTDGTTVTAYVNSASSSAKARNVRYQVVELWPWAVLNVEHGTVTVSGAAFEIIPAGFTPSDQNNAVCIYLGNTTDHTADTSRVSPSHLEVAQAGGLVIARYDSSQVTTSTAGYCLVEFAPGIIKSRNEALVAITTGNASGAATIPAVDLKSTVLFWGGCRYSDGFTTSEALAYLSDATTITAERISTGTESSKIKVTAMEFHPQWVKQIQRGRTTMTANQATADATVNQTATTVLSYVGHKAQNSFGNTEYTLVSVAKQTNTTMRTQRDTGTDFDLVPTSSWEAIEFA